MISIRLLFRICAIVAFCILCHEIYLQSWGDYAGMSQGMAIYMTYASDVLLICWLGSQLTKYVRKNFFIVVVVLLLLLLFFFFSFFFFSFSFLCLLRLLIVVVVYVVVTTSLSHVSEASLQPDRQLQLPFSSGDFRYYPAMCSCR
jgi:hypothetical protein